MLYCATLYCMYPTAMILCVCQHGIILSCICATLYCMYPTAMIKCVCQHGVILSCICATLYCMYPTAMILCVCQHGVILSCICATVLYVLYFDDQVCLFTWSCTELYLWTLRWRTRPATYPEFGNVQLYMVVVQAWVAVVLLVKAVDSTQQDVEDNVIPLLALQVHV